MPHPRRAVLVAVAVASVTLFGAFLLKLPCALHPYEDYFAFRTYCHTSITSLYYGHGHDQDKLPYLETFNEYPVVIGLWMYLAALATADILAFYLLNAALLILCGLWQTQLLARLEPSLPRLLAWSASPVLLAHALDNWELAASLLTLVGWTFWKQRRPFAASLAFGLGAATKIYPGFFLPFLLLSAFQAKDRPAMGRILAGGFLGGGVLNLALMAVDYDAWAMPWRYQSSRILDWETPWTIFNYVYAEPRFWNLVTLAIVIGALALLAWLQWRGALDPLAAGGLLTCVFLLGTRVWSPQYSVWVLPLLVLLRVPWSTLIGFQAAALGVFLIRYQLFIPPPGSDVPYNRAWIPWFAVVVSLRSLYLGLCVLTVLWRQWPRRAGGSSAA